MLESHAVGVASTTAGSWHGTIEALLKANAGVSVVTIDNRYSMSVRGTHL